MPARSASDSTDSGRKKKHKKDKKPQKPADKDKKDKTRKAKKEDSPERGSAKRKKKIEDEEDEVPDRMKPSGLLDEDEDPMPPPKGPPIQQDSLRPGPSRSRDEPRAGFDDRFGGGDEAKGKGKGKGKDKGKGPEGEEQEPKEEPNFEASGLLAMEDNAKNGIPLKFTVPAEARRPDMKWRLYVFAKQNEEPKIIQIHREVGYLFGKDRRVVDVPTDHPTCSKQHAVLHHRQTANMEVKPYILDLESVNGTFLNGKRIEAARYYELKEKDVLKFGMSSREFVLLHGGSANHMKIDPKALRSPSED
mmetsp:Transcript_13307/g.23515  ORF Transcript_13307/g.23515 Transcript_13307/m.23515 type:complete len:305 (+) Transcript_13307:98-1012(+)